MPTNVIGYSFLFVFATIFFIIGRRSNSSRENKHQYANLIQLSPDPIIILDISGTLKSLNLAAEEAFLYPMNELVGKHVTKTDVIAELSISKVIQEFELAVSGRKGSPFELEITRKDKTCGVFEVNMRLLKSHAKIMGVQVIFRDVSDRRRLEAQILQSQKMEAMGQLAGGVAHDFNNLLTVINGYSELQLQILAADNPVRADLEEILKAGNMAKGLTSQLLAFSRKQVFETKVISINDLIVHMDKMFRRLIRENIELRVFPAPELGSVKADPASLEQVLTNLVVNACDAMPQGGKLVIETKNVILDDEYARYHPEVAAGEYVLLAVSDTGSGMSEEVKKRIFEPFFTTKEKGKGTGLGLATSYGIIKQSGGNLTVYSEIGYGTTFKIYLPRFHALAETLFSAKKAEDLPHGHEAILIVEDEILVRGFTCRVLREQGYQAFEASNGEEGLLVAQNLSSKKIDLLVTDMVMPQIGGRELANRLKVIWPEMRVIFTSGYTENITIYHESFGPMQGFLQKPFSPLELAVKVREILDRKR